METVPYVEVFPEICASCCDGTDDYGFELHYGDAWDLQIGTEAELLTSLVLESVASDRGRADLGSLMGIFVISSYHLEAHEENTYLLMILNIPPILGLTDELR